MVTQSVEMIKILHDRHWDGTIRGKGEGGKLRMTWRRGFELEIEANGHSWCDLIQMARNRDDRRMFVRGLYPVRGEMH